jgi:hypothetical protein
MPQPNKTKPPLQVLAVAEGNSENNKVWDEACDGVNKHILPQQVMPVTWGKQKK